MSNNWFNLRDQFIKDGDVTKLTKCDHEDARWLVALGNPTESSIVDDTMAQCYGRLMSGGDSTNINHPYAQAHRADRISNIMPGHAYILASLAANAGDPLGMVVMGDCQLRSSDAVHWYRKAAKMGYYPGIAKYRAQKYARGDPRRYMNCGPFYIHKIPSIQHFFAREGKMPSVACQFELGRYGGWAEPVYLTWLPILRTILDTWSICARRLGIVRDIRILIAKRLWKYRYLSIKEH